MERSQPSMHAQSGFSVVEVCLIVLVVAALATTGWVVYQRRINSGKTATHTSSSQVTNQQKNTTTQSPLPDPYKGWPTYTSATEKLTFRYPPDWKTKASSYSTQVNGADSFVMTSPTGSLSVVWYSVVEGIGGACNTQIMPGTTSSTDMLGPCPYWYVLDKQKLTGADLYYVDGVMEQSNGQDYTPWCALQAPTGIVQDESNIGYMLFDSKYNQFVGTDGKAYGPYQPELACGQGFGGLASNTGTTKAQAIAALSSPEMQQAKLILLSASY